MKKRLLCLIAIILVLLAIFCFCTKKCKSDSDIVQSEISIEMINAVEFASSVVDDTLALEFIVRSDEIIDETVSLKNNKPSVDRINVTTTTIDTITEAEQDDKQTTLFCETKISEQGCNFKIPGWGKSLGVVSFATDRTWTVGSQTWSDAVTTTNCQKKSFNGSDDPKIWNYNADCRSNPDYPGDFFSWCAVVRFQDELCPEPWRVPTHWDFISLDRTLGGGGRYQYNSNLRQKYLNDWGGHYGGYCHSGGALDMDLDSWAFYWSKSESNATSGFFLYFGHSNSVNPQRSYFKQFGLSLRCVR